MVGGSYSGALTAWTESVAPGTFWAYHATSAPVEAIYDYVGATLLFLSLLAANQISGNTFTPSSKVWHRTAARTCLW